MAKQLKGAEGSDCSISLLICLKTHLSLASGGYLLDGQVRMPAPPFLSFKKSLLSLASCVFQEEKVD